MRGMTWRASLAVVVSVAALLLASGTAYAAPKIDYLRCTNPVAYDLKAWQTTHFYASVDTTGVWAELVVKTAQGDVRIYRGPIGIANKPFWFHSWSGKRNDGTRLPSSAGYTVQLTVSKGGQSSAETAKVIVSRVCVIVSGTLPLKEPNTKTHRFYMIEGPANLYVTGWTSATHSIDPPNSFAISLRPSGSAERPLGLYTIPDPRALHQTTYLRGDSAVSDAGVQTLSLDPRTNHRDIFYGVTWLQ